MIGAKHQHRSDTDQRGARRDALADGQKQLRGRLLAADLYPLEDYFAAKGTSAPVVLDQADKEPLLVVVGTWVDEVGEEPAVALGGLLSLRDALRADLADPPPD